MTARTFAIGDIHGCDVAFEHVLQLIEPTTDDTIVVLGDAIDRGPNSAAVIELLVALDQDLNLVFVLGNHEQMMFEAMETGLEGSMWMMHGGVPTLESYGGQIENIPESHLNLIRSEAVQYWETDTDIYVHANLDVDLPLAEQNEHVLRWQHLTGQETAHPSGRRVLCGHTPQSSGVPRVMPGWACIDTFAYGGMYVTAVDVATNEIFQANQSGHTRKGVRLDDLV